jgi:hypothetical protein
MIDRRSIDGERFERGIQNQKRRLIDEPRSKKDEGIDALV